MTDPPCGDCRLEPFCQARVIYETTGQVLLPIVVVSPDLLDCLDHDPLPVKAKVVISGKKGRKGVAHCFDRRQTY